LVIFFLYFFVACLTFHPCLTNEFTPGGDGSRIYPYLKYMEKVPEHFPFWQAHKHHGYPLLADPENHMPLSMILNTESKYFNIHLNLVFFFLTAILAFCFYAIARIMGMSQIASSAVGLISIVSYITLIRAFMHGAFSAFIITVLSWIAITILAFLIMRKKHYIYFTVVPLTMVWLVTAGYYLPLAFHVPAFTILACIYVKCNESLINSIIKPALLLFISTVFMLLLSMPILLPLIDGIVLSKYFFTESSVISISEKHIFNYYFGLWPFIILSIIFSSGHMRRWAYILTILGSINFVLILFYIIDFETFFSLWHYLPIVKNIRHQLPFYAFTGIAAAFGAGIFIDSIRERIIKDKMTVIVRSGFIILMFFVALIQYQKNMPTIMLLVTLIFIVMIFMVRQARIVIGLIWIIIIIMAINLSESPIRNRLVQAKNASRYEFTDYQGNYAWWDSLGYDCFTPTFPDLRFSMVFLNEYRLLLSLLHDQEINVQRPHWVGRHDDVDTSDQRPQIARLMGINDPGSSEWESPFRIYDQWIVANDKIALDIMKQEDFSPDGPIILADDPGILPDTDIMLSSEAVLTGKTAETLTLQVNTNKESVLLIPEIYHRNWYAWVNGEKTPVIKAFASLRAVTIPPGDHEIKMKFIYKPFWWGLYIALASLVVMVVLTRVFRRNLENFFWPDKISGASESRS
jgi:hypothetical protein